MIHLDWALIALSQQMQLLRAQIHALEEYYESCACEVGLELPIAVKSEETDGKSTELQDYVGAWKKWPTSISHIYVRTKTEIKVDKLRKVCGLGENNFNTSTLKSQFHSVKINIWFSRSYSHIEPVWLTRIIHKKYILIGKCVNLSSYSIIYQLEISNLLIKA